MGEASSRLLTAAAEAFVDRASIDWPALLARTGTSPADRAAVESLRHLARIREAGRAARQADATSPRASRAARVVVLVAGVQTACCLAVMATAFSQGESVSARGSQVLVALSFVAGAFLVGTGGAHDARRLPLLAVFVASASAFARAALNGLPGSWSDLVAIVVRGIVPEALVPACLWQFALDFPRVRRFTAFDVMARRLAAGLWLLGTALAAINIAVTYQLLTGGLFAVLLRDHPGHLFWRLFSLALLPCVVTMAVRSRRAPAIERRRVARLVMAFVGGTAPFVVFGVLETASPAIDRWFTVSTSVWRESIYGLIVVALAATPLLTAAAVIADRPFALRAMLRRGWPYGLAKGIWTAAIVAALIAIFATLDAVRGVAGDGAIVGWRGWRVTACVALAALFVAARRHVLDAFDRRVLRRAVDYQDRLTAALERLRVARGTREIVDVLARELSDDLSAERVHLLTAGDRELFVDASGGASPLSSDAAWVAMLCDTETALDLSSDGPLFALLPPADRDWILANRIELAAAVKRRDGAIAALVVIGPKRTGFPFDRRDSWLVATLLSATARAWEDESPVEDCADDIREPSHHIGAVGEVAFECPRCGLVCDVMVACLACGEALVLAAVPRRAGTFVVDKRIGTGGMGVVYLARDTTLDRPVALKTLPALRADAVRRLRDEARAMAALNHEALATIYGLEMWRSTPILVVEYFPNGTLEQRLKKGPLSTAEVVTLGLRLADALLYMHGRGVLHRDLKPSNVAFTATGAIKLLDFGLAAEDGRIGGTLGYLAQEIFDGAPQSPASDLWGLAVTMIEALTGTNPLAADVRRSRRVRHVSVSPSDALARTPGGDRALRAFFERALADRPERRFQSASEFRAGLEAATDRP